MSQPPITEDKNCLNLIKNIAGGKVTANSINNEKTLKAFILKSGIIQGCPITNNIIVHFLACSVRNEKNKYKV